VEEVAGEKGLLRAVEEEALVSGVVEASGTLVPEEGPRGVVTGTRTERTMKRACRAVMVGALTVTPPRLRPAFRDNDALTPPPLCCPVVVPHPPCFVYLFFGTICT